MFIYIVVECCCQARNGHEQTTSVLIERGADTSVVDDDGHTPVDVAKTKRIKTKLKQAWMEATQKKEEEAAALGLEDLPGSKDAGASDVEVGHKKIDANVLDVRRRLTCLDLKNYLFRNSVYFWIKFFAVVILSDINQLEGCERL